jgi:hypothetical protein
VVPPGRKFHGHCAKLYERDTDSAGGDEGMNMGRGSLKAVAGMPDGTAKSNGVKSLRHGGRSGRVNAAASEYRLRLSSLD